jgi:hemolysin III
MQQSASEEAANSISHGLGIVFGLIALPLLSLELPTYIYGASFLFLFASSTAYHLVSSIPLKRALQKIDHVSIYFMIAGSYTPFVFLCLSEAKAWWFFRLLWGIVLLGTVFKLLFTGKFERLSLFLYLAMGWMVVFIAKPFMVTFDLKTILLVAIGGLFYTGGVYFYANDHRRYYHLIWHLFVLAGAVSHYLAIASL